MSAQAVTAPASTEDAGAFGPAVTSRAGEYARRFLPPTLRQIPALRLIPSPVRGAPRAPFVSLILGLLGAGMIGMLLLNTVMQQRSFQLDAMERANALLAERAQVIADELAAKQAPAALAAEARSLGMVANTSPVFLNLADGSIRGELVPAKADPAAPSAPAALLPGRGPIQGALPAPVPKPVKAKKSPETGQAAGADAEAAAAKAQPAPKRSAAKKPGTTRP